MRLAGIFIVICMAIIAGSAGAIAFLYLGADTTQAIMLAIAVFAILVLYNTVASRLGVRTVVGHQLTDLSRGGAEQARQLAELGRRLEAMEAKVETALDRSRELTDPLSAEIGELGTLVKQLAESVAAHDTALDGLSRPAPPAGVLATEALARRLASGPTSAAEAPKPSATASAILAPAISPAAALPFTSTAAASAAPSQDDAVAAVRTAVEAGRIDLYLQPIVTLPQRKVRYYEATSRLRTESGDTLHGANFVPIAEAAGLMPKIDNLVTFRCVQVVRRLLLKNRDIGLFCNLSAATLTDSMLFPQLLEFLEANRALAPSLVLEFKQSAVRTMGPIEHESLAALAERGFRFSLDNVSDLHLEPRELADRGFRFIKVQGNMLLNRAGAAASDIHPADLADLVGRFGIDLVAEKIESEGSVVDLLDYDVRFGQGFLFSQPRPVRAEALQGMADRSDGVAREAAAPAPARSGGTRLAETSAEPSRGERTSALAQLARKQMTDVR